MCRLGGDLWRTYEVWILLKNISLVLRLVISIYDMTVLKLKWTKSILFILFFCDLLKWFIQVNSKELNLAVIVKMLWIFSHSFIFNNCFIGDLEPILGQLGAMWEHTLDGKHTFKLSIPNPSTGIFLGCDRKQKYRERRRELHTVSNPNSWSISEPRNYKAASLSMCVYRSMIKFSHQLKVVLPAHNPVNILVAKLK